MAWVCRAGHMQLTWGSEGEWDGGKHPAKGAELRLIGREQATSLRLG